MSNLLSNSFTEEDSQVSLISLLLVLKYYHHKNCIIRNITVLLSLPFEQGNRIDLQIDINLNKYHLL